MQQCVFSFKKLEPMNRVQNNRNQKMCNIVLFPCMKTGPPPQGLNTPCTLAHIFQISGYQMLFVPGPIFLTCGRQTMVHGPDPADKHCSVALPLHFLADRLAGKLQAFASMSSILLHSLLGCPGIGVNAQTISASWKTEQQRNRMICAIHNGEGSSVCGLETAIFD